MEPEPVNEPPDVAAKLTPEGVDRALANVVGKAEQVRDSHPF